MEKKIKEMSKLEFREYKKIKERERRNNLTSLQKAENNWIDKDRKMEARSQLSNELKEYEQICARQRMRRLRKKLKNEKNVNDTEKDESQILNDDLKSEKDWFDFYKQNDKTKNILKEKASDLFAKFEDKEKKETEEIENKERNEIDEISEKCVCDFDVDCAFCIEIHENEKGLCEDSNWTKEDEEKEFAEYKAMVNNERKDKRRQNALKAKQPIPALPERELCQYEQIREDNISQRKAEWAKLEVEWEANYQNKMDQLK